MRKTKKSLALFLVLAMVLTLFAGVAQASTESVRVRGFSVNIAPVSPAVLGMIEVTNAAERVVGGGTRLAVTIRLPEGMTFNAVPAVGSFWLNGGAAVANRFAALPARDDYNRNIVFTLTEPATDIVNLRIPVGSVNFPTGHRGAINAEVRLRAFAMSDGQEITLWEQTSTVQVGNVLAAGTTSEAVSKPTVQRGITAQTAGNIRITETVLGSITTPAANEIVLEAPAGVFFSTAPTVVETGGLVADVTTLSFPSRNVSINVTTASTLSRGVITIENIRFQVEPQVADGDVIVTIRGAAGSNVTAAQVANATVGVPAAGQITIDADPATPAADRRVTAGRADEVIANIRLRETVAGAIQAGRVLSFTLPEGFTWGDVSAAFGANPGFIAPTATSNAGRTISYWTTGVSVTAQTRIFTGLSVNAAANAPAGDIVVTLGGTAGVTGTVVVGVARRPYTVTAVTTPNVRADQRNQTLGNLVITENFAGALIEGKEIKVDLPVGVTVSSGAMPTVTASGAFGRMSVLNNAVEISNDRRSFTIDTGATASTAVTTWTVSGIRVDLDRVPLGNISLTVGGTGLIPIINAGASGAVNDADVLGKTVAEVTVANVITATAKRTVFTVDATAYTVDGAAQPALDVAPVIQDGRTMMPIRAAATAAGVTAENILFDAGAITIIRGDRIAQFTLNSRVMVVNGVAMNMDVAPALVAGRALIPVRWVGTALGVPVLWDGTARTVTVTVQ